MIGKNIQFLRKSKGLSLSEVAERAKISKSYLSNIERNVHQNPSVNVMEKIADVLDVEMSVLLNNGDNDSAKLIMDSEWVEVLTDLKESGIEKEQIQEYKTLFEFIKWRNENLKRNK